MHDGNIAGARFFFVGIGGSGMMPLAMILAARGGGVAGSDRALDQGRVPAKFDDLRARGIALFPQDGSGIVSADQIVVASAAVEASVPDIVAADRLGCERMTRAELNAALFNASALPIGVAGTSGKSTVTGMIATILAAAGRDPTVMNGAVMKDFARPDAPFASALVGAGDAYVSEVDESDGSIALYRPRIAVLNNISLDHKELDELNALFADFIGKAARAIVNIDNPDAAALAMHLPRDRVTTFAIDREADLRATNLSPEPFGIRLDLTWSSSPFPLACGERAPSLSHREREGAPKARKGEDSSRGTRIRISLSVPGRHNISNALAAIGACVVAGVPIAETARAIEGFTGLRRRFDIVGEAAGVSVIDDFAHNPDKIAATLETLHVFPGRLLLLFQPHGFGPLKVMRRELAAMFAAKLASGDLLVMPDPVYHGGTTTREVTSADIVRDVAISGRKAFHIPDRDAAAAHLVAEARAGDRIIVMGARDDSLSLLAAGMRDSLAARADESAPV